MYSRNTLSPKTLDKIRTNTQYTSSTTATMPTIFVALTNFFAFILSNLVQTAYLL